jgi:dTDP-4-amino-4,6-dideoxygalactose transaminase
MNKEAKDQCLKLIKQYTGKEVIKITTSGDAAIFVALYIAKQQGYNKVLIPDQGGWLTYKTFPKLLDLEIEELKTDYGIINSESLTQHKDTILLYTSYAGYFAAQEVQEIYNVAKQQGIFVILDVSGALSHETLGKEGDIILGSFGKWKIADFGYAGFLASSVEIITKEIKCSDIFKLAKIKNINYEKLKQKFENAPKRLASIQQRAQQVKQDCKEAGFTVMHEDKEGLNVIVKYNNEEEKEAILNFCKNNNFEYKECPLYIKVLENAISIEVRRNSR